jgi:predicted ATPase
MKEKIEGIEDLHELLFSHLIEKSEKDKDLRFSIRKSDKENRLSKGYYFYGNESYLAISFWSGTNWKNKTPNIILVFVPEDEAFYLEIAVNDSEEKTDFVKQFLLPELNLVEKHGRFYKPLYGDSYIGILEYFINEIKPVIDNSISRNNSFFKNIDLENRLGFIDPDLFLFRVEKAQGYRKNKLRKIIKDEPAYLSQLHIRSFAGIDDLAISDLPNSTQWIFFTGANGSGKSSILKALTLSLCPNVKEHLDFDEPGHFKIEVELHRGEKKVLLECDAMKLPVDKEFLPSEGFAAYGPARLMRSDLETQQHLSKNELTKRQSPSYSIFHTDGILLDFAEEVDKLRRTKFNSAESRERHNIIIETLIECIGPLSTIFLEYRTSNTTFDSVFVEQDENGDKFIPVKFFQLSSGTKSLIAMIGDMMVRLFRQQPDVFDIGQLKGIVLIDEIDIHFHPKQQKMLIEALTNSFPKVQFIVTTHSPIPLLGAPKNSVIFSVRRTVKKGVEVQRLDDKVMFDRILPNAILSSPIFGFDDFTPTSKSQVDHLITEDYYNEGLLYEKLEQDVNAFLTNEKQQELIKMFSKDETDNSQL